MNLTVDWTYSLFYDDSPLPLLEKLAAFRHRYSEIHGCFPTECITSPADADNWIGGAGMVVRVSDTVDRHHFWVGADLRQSVAVQGMEAVQEQL